MPATYSIPLTKSIWGLIHWSVFAICLLPALLLTWGLITSQLGPNPVETLTHETGNWGLRFLLISLAVTPLRRWFSWNWLLRFRRMLGLYSFFYICLHLLTYLLFDHFFDIASIAEDILERPYITVGFFAWVLMVPLAITSWSYFKRRLGKRWGTLHRCVYVVAIAAVVHFWWLVKADWLEPLLYGFLLLVLLVARILFWRKKQLGRRRH